MEGPVMQQTKFDVPINSTVAETLTDGQLDLVKMVDWVYGKTPPVTWDDAARRAVFQIFNHSFKVWDRMSDAREYLDYLIDEMGPESSKNISGNVAASYWAILGRTAANIAEKNNIFTDTEGRLESYVDEISKILVRKQRDYGHHNIARFGRAGLLVRMHDKVARLENLLKNDVDPENESVVDNFIDVIGYASIGIMWEKNWFLLDLAPAAESSEK
jgi:hypothetical protein